MGKIKVTKDSEVLEIEPSDLKSAINDGYRQVQTIPVTNGKEVLYIDACSYTTTRSRTHN